MVQRTRRIARRLAIPALGFALGILTPGGGSVANDADLFAAASVPPNVLLLMDSSGSMNGIMYHKAWPGGGSATCDVIPPTHSGTANIYDDNSQAIRGRCSGSGCFLEVNSSSPGFVSTPGLLGSSDSGYVERTFCGQTRKLYHDGNVEDRGADSDYSRWFDPYIDWYFGLDPSDVTTTYGPDDQTAAEILAEVEQDNNGTNYITGVTYPLYKRSRITAATEVAKEVMYRTNSRCSPFVGDCGSYENNIRFGLAQFAPGAHGAYVSADIEDYTSNKATIESDLDSIDASGNTPLGESLFKVYTYFMSRTAGERPKGKNGTTEFPAYDYRLSNGDGDAPVDDRTQDPVDLECRRSFIIMLTDGEPTSDNFATSGNDTDGFAAFKSSLIGDYAVDAAGDADIGTDSTPEEGSPWIDSAGAGYLDDVALFMQQNDLRPVEYPDTLQTVNVYTIGFGATGAPVESLLQKTANHGNGIYRKANQSDELVSAMVESLSHIIEKTHSFTAATVPASRATDGNNFFATYFIPSAEPFWEGHVKLFEFNALGEIRDKPGPSQTEGDCALEDEQEPTTGRCEIGRLKVELDGYWDAANEIPAPGSRNLYVSYYPDDADIPSSIPSTPIAFSTALNAAALGVNGFGSAEISSYDTGANDVTGIATDEELADAIIQYVRGCDFEEDTGNCQDRAEISNGTVVRGNKLWDSSHSNPVVVGPPNRGLREASYKAFLRKYQHRKRVIYAGSNGGFVHGFNAGEYRVTNTADFTDAPGYDRGTGVEEFGFMAYPARPNIKDLPKQHGFYMDGSPVAGDVWLYPAANQNPVDITANDAWMDWRTVLMGGMREGGRTIWAIDVTDPPDYDSADGESGTTSIGYPGYMWEFPCEAPACDTYRATMGETWSEPVITRVKVKLNCDGDAANPCPTYDRWVAIFGAGYDPKSDPNPKALSSSATDYDAAHPGGRAVFMVDVKSGEVLAVRKFDASGSSEEQAMLYAFTASPAVFDLDRDGYADVVYLGDLGGNLWKWVIHEPVRDPINGTGDVSQPDWPFLQLFTAEGCHAGNGCDPGNSEPEPHFKSIFFPPTGALVNSKLWLAFGTGERTRLDFEGTTDAEKNRYYVMRDPDPLEMEPPSPDTLPRYTDAPGEDFVDIASLTLGSGDRLRACESALGGYAGYYIEGAQGEKFVTDSTIFFGVVLAGSFIPTTGASVCESGGGDAYVYGFDLFCAEGIFPPPDSDPSGPNARFIKIGQGLPAKPRVSVGPLSGGGGGPGPGPGPSPCQDKVIVMTSEADGFTNCPGGRPDSGSAMKSWRDF
jgi:type IV pilus assembly protein PilY1